MHTITWVMNLMFSSHSASKWPRRYMWPQWEWTSMIKSWSEEWATSHCCLYNCSTLIRLARSTQWINTTPFRVVSTPCFICFSLSLSSFGRLSLCPKPKVIINYESDNDSVLCLAIVASRGCLSMTLVHCHIMHRFFSSFCFAVSIT